MEAQLTNNINNPSHLAEQAHCIRVLLVGSEDAFLSEEAQRILSRENVRIFGTASTLLYALSLLQTEPIELVLLSCDFCQEELSLFAFDARRLGYSGLVVHVVRNGNIANPEPAPMQQTRRAELPGGNPSHQHFDSTPAAYKVPQRKRASENIPTTPPLTRKETAVFCGIAEGRTNFEIARELSCSEGSIKAAVQRLFTKFAVRKRAQLLREAYEHRVLPMGMEFPCTDALPAGQGNTFEMEGTGRQVHSSKAHTSAPSFDLDMIQAGDIAIDCHNRQVWVRGQEKWLTPNEFKLLTLLARRPQVTMTHQELASSIWTKDSNARESLRVLIQALRKKIDETSKPRYVLTTPRLGYRLNPYA